MTNADRPKGERFREELLEWGEENVREFPWRESDASLYEVFVAEFFLTQTPADNVDRVYPQFLEEFPSLEAIDEASVEEVADAVEPLGFQNMRAHALKDIASEYEELPESGEELQSLTRVGPYVANATLCFARGERLPLMDRNVRRVYRRVFDSDFPSAESEQIEFARRLLPESSEEIRKYNMALLDFGALVCTKESPSCESCFARSYCDYYSESVSDGSR